MRNRVFVKAPAGSGLQSIEGSWAPSILQLIRLRRDPIRFGALRRKRFGPVGATRLLGAPMVMATGAQAAEEVLVNRDKAFSNGGGWNLVIGPFFPRGLMLLDFDEHRAHRRIMQEAFTPAALRGYFTRLDPVARAAADELAGGQVELYPYFKDLTLRIAAEVFVDVELTDEEYLRLATAFTDTVRAGTTLLRLRIPGSRYARGFAGRRYLEDFFTAHLPAKRAADGSDLFSRLCQATTDDGQRFSDDDVVNHMIFVLMAAHDTTQIALTQLGYQLARHPRWQQRVYDEIASLPQELTYDDLGADRLPVLDRVLRETLRMCTPVPGYPRRAVKDTAILGRYIPAGTRVTVPSLTNHNSNEQVWEHAETFDPDRFLPERFTQVHRFAWTPFGGGAHKCIGMYFAMREITLLYVHLLRRFELSVPSGYTAPMDYSALPIPTDGLPVTLTPRQDRNDLTVIRSPE
nr:cytochrome P450 [Gordonia alkanivorans]